VIIGAWRDHDNRVRPHSSLGYRPPAPMTLEAIAQQLPTSPSCSRLSNRLVQNPGQVRADTWHVNAQCNSEGEMHRAEYKFKAGSTGNLNVMDKADGEKRMYYRCP
jgi:hypothetical protein